MIEHVYSELKSPIGFLRLRAAWLYGQLGDFNFKNSDHVRNAINDIFQLLWDSELPVRVTAAISMEKFLIHKEAQQVLKPALKSVLEIYLKLMNDIDSEELVQALEYIVKKFKDDIEPYAIDLCGSLVQAFHRLAQTNVEDDDGESALAAVGCVTTIRRILHAV